MKKPAAIDLFSGCGGLTLGLKLAGFRVIAAIENNDVAVETFRANHPRTPVWSEDIQKISARGLMKSLDVERGQLDLLAGCPPCQGFSILRTKNGAARNRDRRNGLVSEVLRFARAFHPKAIMLENVPGLRTRNSFQELCRGLRRLGYKIKIDVKDAADYGVPQRRKRLILLAGRGFEIQFAPPLPNRRTVRQTIGNLPRAEQARDSLHRLPQNRSKKVLKLIRAIPKDGGSRADLPQSSQLKCHENFYGFNDVYGRMAWDNLAPTITSGCFNPSKGRFLHPIENRAISLREAALLQTFPKTYFFPVHAGKEAIGLMIGNALPPLFIREHAIQIIKSSRKQRNDTDRKKGRLN